MKAQIWSIDMIVSVAIVMIAFMVLLNAWSEANNEVIQNQKLESLLQRVILISNILTRTPGLPSDWNATNVKSIGLSSREGVLSESKVLELKSLNYDTSKFLMGIKTEEFYITITDINGTILTIQGMNATAGIAPTNPKTTIPIGRLILLEKKPAIFTLLLWK